MEPSVAIEETNGENRRLLMSLQSQILAMDKRYAQCLGVITIYPIHGVKV